MKLSILSQISGIPRHTLTARINSKFSKEEVGRDNSNHITLTPEQCRECLSSDLINPKGKIIRVGNLKGGVGKTSISYLMSDALSSLGLKVCMVDFDIQMNLTSLFLPKEKNRLVFLDAVIGTEHKKDISEIIIKINEHLSIIPSSLRNSLIEKELISQSSQHQLHWLNDICFSYLRENFDVIILDTPPDLSTLNSVTGLCLTSNDNFIFPVDPDVFAFDGVDLVLNDVKKIRKSYRVKASENPEMSIVMNRFDQTVKEDLRALMEAHNRFDNGLSETIIRKMAKFKEYVKNKIPIDELSRSKELFKIMNGLLVQTGLLKQWGKTNEAE
jgi:chromosome partitioning protein